MRPTKLLALMGALACGVVGLPAGAQGIRNAPPPRALETAAYVFAAANVCGYRIGTAPFEALLARYQVSIEDVRPPRGPFGAKVQTIFALMSNQMMQNRDAACRAVAGEYGPEGNIAPGILLPAAREEAPPARQP
ncbi:hypothetical protein [Methylobacterium frigidaeris]|uniref:TIGR02301 family protein n=1 Tax=Methylobacterium frigidaeris TaxID=2038277 RepID=A0AA37M444_9HYPH|nr:hypothetical protein [Methylobacterium frigidaeris]PIK69954.1 hypothetical protein CS379_27175 [Methylobacterium frigidaeris]GJD61960.1 hypothetical protein MPEAHAMD_2109 [Methylobacterium frigidaeris]